MMIFHVRRLLTVSLIAGSMAVSSASGQILQLNDPYEVSSDANNGRLSRVFNSGEPIDSYAYAAATVIEVRSAGSNPNRRMSAGIFYFVLPELAAGVSAGNASLAFSLISTANSGPGPGNLDLYGLGFLSTAAIAADERPDFWHWGDSDDRAGMGIASVVNIQDNLISAADYPDGLAAADPSAPVRVSTDAGAAAPLGVFLNALYGAGAQPGDYAVFRLSYDSTDLNPNSSILGYNIAGTGAAPALTDPTLAFTAVPEPSTVALLIGSAVLGGAVFLRRRRC